MKSFALNRDVALLRESEQNESNNKFRISYNGLRRENRLKPHRSFRNWSKLFKIPTFCFIDIAIFCLYLILALYHEDTIVSQTVDISDAIDNFFVGELNEIDDSQDSTISFFENQKNLNVSKNKSRSFSHKKISSGDDTSDSLNIIDPTVGVPFGNGQIYLINDFLFLIDKISEKLFDFPDDFPMKYPVYSPGYVYLTILLENETKIQYILTDDANSINPVNSKTIKSHSLEERQAKTFLDDKIKITRPIKKKSNNKKIIQSETNQKSTTNSQPSKFVIPYLSTFYQVTLKASYHIQIGNTAGDMRINLGITSNFKKDPRTDTLIFDVSHTRIKEKKSLEQISMVLYSFNYSIPIVILIFNFISIWIQITSIRDLFLYSKSKNQEVGLDSREIFNQHFSKWTIYSIITHFISIIAMLLYMNIGQDISQPLPPINIITSIATCMQCLLLIRYLNLKESTFLIIKVLYKSLFILLAFLLGCLPFFIAFWAFGICFWGHLTFMFATPLQCASYLFCVMHGDSILGFFDNTIIQNDYSVYLGFIYCLAWVCFALLLMFNVTISIVQDVLRGENAKMEHKDEKYTLPQRTPLNMDLLTNGLFHSL